MRSVIFQLLAKVQNMYHNSVGRLREKLLAPHILINILDGYDFPLLSEHILQNIQFQIRQIKRRPVFSNDTLLMIDLYPVKFNDFSTIDEISPKEGFEFRKKNIFLIRSFEDIVGAGCISIQFFIQIQVMRQIQNWKVTERPQRTADVKSGYVGIGVFRTGERDLPRR